MLIGRGEKMVEFEGFFEFGWFKIILFLVMFMLFMPVLKNTEPIKCLKPCERPNETVITFLVSETSYKYYMPIYLNMLFGLIGAYFISSALVFMFLHVKEHKESYNPARNLQFKVVTDYDQIDKDGNAEQIMPGQTQ